MIDLFQASLLSQGLKKTLDYYEKNSKKQAEKDGPYRTDLNPATLLDQIATLRRDICEIIFTAPSDKQASIAKFDDFHMQSARLRGALYDYPLTEIEEERLQTCISIFETNWTHPDSFKAFVVLSFYTQSFTMPLMKDALALPETMLKRYIYYLARQPHLMSTQDEDLYLKAYPTMIDWFCEILDEKSSLSPSSRAMVANILHNQLTFGTCYYVDAATTAIVHRREKLIKAIANNLADRGSALPTPKGTKLRTNQNKIKLGIITRNLGDFTDTRALYSQFCAYDKSRYEIYWYSIDIYDPSTTHSSDFYRRLYGLIDHTVSLRGDGEHMAQQIIQDDLDILYLGTAFSFGVKAMDLLTSQRLAPIQIITNQMIPGSSGLSNQDYFLIPEGDDEAMANYKTEATEKTITIPDPLLWYERREPAPPDDQITRKALGMPEDAILYCSGATANKQMAGTLHTWLNILDEVPHSYLLFYPFNPAWGGYYIGLTFLARLRACLKSHPNIDPSRIVIVREVTPEEGNRLLALCDIYLGSFPHAGATSAMLALVHGKPLLARRSIWLRSASDASFLKSLGIEELIAHDNDDLTKIGIRLGSDTSYRRRITLLIKEKMATAPFFDIENRSLHHQSILDQIVELKKSEHKQTPEKD